MIKASNVYDTIIIGAGISGMTAGIYASRKRMNYIVITKNVGGQFMESGEVLNYPGIVQTTGIEFFQTMEKQLEFNDVKLKKEHVTKIEKNNSFFRVITDKSEYETKTVIIATGSHPRKLDIPGENKLANKGVTYCSICDGPLFSGMEVAIVGGGDSALEAVDFMKDIASKIHVIVRKDKFKGHEYLQERIKKNPKVEVHFNSVPKKILGKDFVTGLIYEQNGNEIEISLNGVIIEAGRIPETSPFKDIVEMDEHDHIIIDCQARTSVPGIFAAGDCASGHEYQYVIAAGQGCMALIKAAKYLAELKY